MFVRTRRAIVVAVLPLLAGCATAGQVTYAARRPDVARADADARDARMDDDRTLAAPTLARGAYVRAVLHRNPSVTSARFAWRAALARVRQAGSFDDPMLDVGFAPLSVASSSARVGYQVGITQRLPWFGKRALDAAVADAEADAVRADYETTRRDLALTAAVLFDDYFVAVHAIEINTHHVDLVRTMREAAAAQYASGRASAQDPLQAEVELTHLEHDAIMLNTARRVTVAQMNELLHRPPDAPLPPPADLATDAGAETGAPSTDRAIAARSEIAAAEMHARAEATRAERAGREAYPDVTLSTSYNSMWDMPEHRWMVGLGVSLPLQAGRRDAAVEEAEATRARYESDALRMTDKARTEAAVARERLDEAAHVLHLFETRLLPVARQQIDAARAGFVASQNAFVAVVAAERNLRDVELDYQRARADADRRRAELERALGAIPGVGPEEMR